MASTPSGYEALTRMIDILALFEYCSLKHLCV